MILTEPAIDIDGRSDPARRLRIQARLLARSRSPVILQGELGVGKARFARVVHESSDARSRPFRRMSCRSEGWDLTRVWNDLAGGGTLVLERIDETPLPLQREIARALAGPFCKRGGIRVFATSRRDLAVEVLEGRLSADLYYRLRVQCVEIPPLRERREDIPILCRAILQELSREQGTQPPELTADALEAATRYAWPGNIRQLSNELQRCASRCQGAIGRHLLGEGLDERLPILGIRAPLTRDTLDIRVAAFERQVIEDALGATGGNRGRAAFLLGITRRTLQRKLAAARDAGFPVRDGKDQMSAGRESTPSPRDPRPRFPEAGADESTTNPA